MGRLVVIEFESVFVCHGCECDGLSEVFWGIVGDGEAFVVIGLVEVERFLFIIDCVLEWGVGWCDGIIFFDYGDAVHEAINCYVHKSILVIME